MRTTSSRRDLSGNSSLPSPWATQTPKSEPAISLNMMAGLFVILTVTQRDSNRPDTFLTKRGCFSSGMPSQGANPRSPKSWQPLQTPRENVSGRL